MEDPVAKLKELQRTDSVGKVQWEAYTDQLGSGIRDPSKHDPDFVWGFLQSYEAGVRLEAKSSLTTLMKEGSRRSTAWKRCWEAYCTSHGQTTFDPAEHDPSSLAVFLSYLGDSGEKVLAMMGATPPQDGYGWDGPPRKKVNVGGPGKEATVIAVKQFQKQSEENKQIWATFCDMNLGGMRDPARHDISTLQNFLLSNGVTPPSTTGVGVGVARPSSAHSHYGSQAVVPPPGAEGLVARIKEFQRQGEAQRENWGRFADEQLGGRRDPARADPYMLQEFCNAMGI